MKRKFNTPNGKATGTLRFKVPKPTQWFKNKKAEQNKRKCRGRHGDQ